MDKLKENWRRYVVSSIVTFLSGFCVAIVPVLETLDMSDLKTSAIVGLILVGIRGGVKLLMEAFIGAVR